MLARVSLRKAMTRAALLVATLTLAIVAEAPQAQADTVTGFILCTNCGVDPFVAEGTVTLSNDGILGALSQFTVAIDFTSVGGKLLNVYFEDTEWGGLSFVSVSDSLSSTNYVQPATPLDPPAEVTLAAFGGSWEGVGFGFTADPASTAITGSGGSLDAVLTFLFSGLSAAAFPTFALHVLSTFDQGFRIAMHIGECTAGGESCMAIAAPIPGAIWLFISALLGLVGIGYRKREKLAAA